MPFGLECQELHVQDQHSGQILTLDQVGEGVVTFTPVMASGPGPFNQTWDAKASTGFLWWKDLDFSWD